MKYTRLFVVSAIVLNFNSAVAAGREWWESVHIGADAQVRRMDFKGGFGDNMLQHHSPQGNIYGGVNFNKYLGLEFGYEATSTRTRMVTLTTGDVATGTPIRETASPAIFRSKAKIKGPHLDLVGLWFPAENSPLQIIGAVGVSIIKGTFERQTLQLGNMSMDMTRSLSDRKSVLRLTGGVQYMVDKNWGIRLTVGWINTGRMVILANDGGAAGANSPEIKPKNSTVYGLGALWAF